MSEVMKRDWLLKRGTTQVFVRSPILAQRDDMISIDDEEAQSIIAKVEAERQAALIKPQPKIEEINAAQAIMKTLEVMSEEQLKAKAFELKVFLRKNATIESMREKISETLMSDAEAMQKLNRKIAPAVEMANPVPIIESTVTPQ
jgi:hypothetical protein